jgi:hypothetical protein
MRKSLLGALLGTIVFGIGSANAAIIMTFSDNLGNFQTITDQGADDQNNAPTIVSYSGNLFAFFNVAASAGVNTNFLGTPSLDLSVNILSGGPRTLTITLTDTFTGANGAYTVVGSIGGTASTGESVVATAWVDPTRKATSPTFTGTSSVPPTNFSGVLTPASGASVTGGSFLLTQQVVLQTAENGITSFDFAAGATRATVPEPSTLWSGGIGMLLCGLAALRRRRA